VIEILHPILAVADTTVFAYVILYVLMNVVLLALSLGEVRSWLQRRDLPDAPTLGRFPPLVSVVVPAWDEELTVVETVRSLLRLDYPRFEIVIVDDGSTDQTSPRLIEAFGFLDEPGAALLSAEGPRIPTAPLRRVLAAPVPAGSLAERLVLIEKANGGKADALNAGVNLSEGALICSMDADSIIVPDALSRVVSAMLDSPDSAVACGVQVAVCNGSEVVDGRVRRVRLPRSLIARVQVVEYMRSFTQGRTALGRMNMLLILSGVFAVFRRDLLLDAGAFLTESTKSKASREYCGDRPHTVCEDMEIVVRIHRYLLDRGRSGELLVIPEPLAWTETPETFRDLGRQRARWYRGLLECLSLHRQMIGRPRFGVVGMVSLPYQLVFEAAGPIVELIGLIALPLTVLSGLADIQMILLFVAVAMGGNLLISIGSILLATWAETARGRSEPSSRLFSYRDRGSILRLMAAALLENLGYRQIVLFWRLRGLFDFLRGRRGWDKVQRIGFSSPPARSRNPGSATT
jgi:cellulose synthase/poly-beta-1,6-N-acetylglucosamine synthase-like glycosyltransferase